jgi:hypothetical protein
MQQLGFEHLPKQYILNRWCKDANASAKKPVVDRIIELRELEALRAFRRATIRPQFRELENLAVTSIATFNFVRSIISNAKNDVMPMVNMEAPHLLIEAIQEREDQREKDEVQKFINPLLSRCKGRKKRPARFISIVETNVKKGRTCSYCRTK